MPVMVPTGLDPRRGDTRVAPLSTLEFEFVASLQLPPDHAAAAKARRFVAETMRDWGFVDAVPDAELLVSELVTNAVLHARSESRVTIERVGSGLRVSVYDTSPAPPRLREFGPEAVTGRGLLIVDRIARSWGVDPDGVGKCVWFELDGDRDGEDSPTARTSR
jgi:anti-sigma regulatory factor (Ser/Thr protein kinase)